MKICLFYHSLISDWNHGNAHFLRGMVTALLEDKHQVTVFEPLNGWSFSNMVADMGTEPVDEYRKRFPAHQVRFYKEDKFIPYMLNDADLIIVHEWNSPELIKRIGTHRKYYGNYVLLFHDTHHRSLTDFESMKKNDLSGYDGVLAYGDVIKDIYLKNRWIKEAWTWHEAADISIFHSISPAPPPEGDLVWIGNWGEDERTSELKEFIINPVKELELKAKFYGVRYPEEALSTLKKAGIAYGGWLPNYKVPEIFAKYKVTVHVPRRPYVKALPGIPTIRPFEAMACGIPLISSPWEDTEGLFRKNIDYLMVDSGKQMKEMLKEVLSNPKVSLGLIDHGLETIRKRHTCYHRKNELMTIYEKLNQKTEKKPVEPENTDS
jgi:spore maturation protein CgeB